MLSVEDIQAIPGLIERAKAAFAAAKTQAQAEDDAIYDFLRDEFWTFATETLEIDAGALACALWERTRQSKSDNPALHPSQTRKDQALLVVVEGLSFKVLYEEEVIAKIGTNQDRVYQDVVESKATFRVRRPGDGNYYVITDLATLGRRL